MELWWEEFGWWFSDGLGEREDVVEVEASVALEFAVEAAVGHAGFLRHGPFGHTLGLNQIFNSLT